MGVLRFAVILFRAFLIPRATLADLPWRGADVRLARRVRRSFCDKPFDPPRRLASVDMSEQRIAAADRSYGAAYGVASPRWKNTPLRSSVVLIATRPAFFVSRNDVTRNW